MVVKKEDRIIIKETRLGGIFFFILFTAFREEHLFHVYFNFGNQAHVKRSFGLLFIVGSKEWWCVWFVIAAAAFMGFRFRSGFLSFSYPCYCCITIFHLPFSP